MADTPADTIIEQLGTVAVNPAEMETDGLKVKEQTIPDLIAAAKFLGAQGGSATPARGLRFTKLVPPGAS